MGVRVKVKQFAVDMEVKTNGIELEVRQPDDSAQIGDCYVTVCRAAADRQSQRRRG